MVDTKTERFRITELPIGAAPYAMEHRLCAVDDLCADDAIARIGLKGDSWPTPFRVDWLDEGGAVLHSDLVCDDCANSIEAGELVWVAGGYYQLREVVREA